MPKYANGRIPAGVLFTVASGTDSNGYWEFQFSQGTWAKWQAAKRYAENKWGRTLYIRTGWNVYRPLNIQQQARDRACAQGNCLGAAWPGTSSHGGTWSSSRHTGGRLVDALAIDVDPNGLTWAQVWEACRTAGFLCGAITKDIAGIDEPWHIIDLDPWRAVPASEGAEPFPEQNPVEESEEDDMKMKGAQYKKGDVTVYILFNEVSGFYVEHSGAPADYNNKIATSWETNSWPKITEAHANVLKNALNNVRLSR